MLKETTLEDCPVGLFFCGEELCLKTEYGDNDGGIDAYIVSTGEYFCGGVADKIERRKVRVRPVPLDAISVRLG